MFILNDYAFLDGKDISWIWDAYFKEIAATPNIDKFYCVGTRAEEVSFKIKVCRFFQHQKSKFAIQKIKAMLLGV